MSDRLTRLNDALEIAERVGNKLMAANLRRAIRDEQRRVENSALRPPPTTP